MHPNRADLTQREQTSIKIGVNPAKFGPIQPSRAQDIPTALAAGTRLIDTLELTERIKV